MLHFINHCYHYWNWNKSDKVPGQKIERLVREHVPEALISQKEVLKWINAGNWKNYWDQLS
jgi:hypothetical protein